MTKIPEKRKFEDPTNALRQLRDEIRLDLHLATMEMKEMWHTRLEPMVTNAERVAHEASEASQRAVEDAVAAAREFRTSLERRTANGRNTDKHNGVSH